MSLWVLCICFMSRAWLFLAFCVDTWTDSGILLLLRIVAPSTIVILRGQCVDMRGRLVVGEVNINVFIHVFPCSATGSDQVDAREYLPQFFAEVLL